MQNKVGWTWDSSDDNALTAANLQRVLEPALRKIFDRAYRSEVNAMHPEPMSECGAPAPRFQGLPVGEIIVPKEYMILIEEGILNNRLELTRFGEDVLRRVIFENFSENLIKRAKEMKAKKKKN